MMVYNGDCSNDYSNDNLANVYQRVLNEGASNSRYLVAIAGPPGSGKTHFAKALVSKLNANHEACTPVAAMVMMDGFHLDNETLASRGILAKKGAPNTFDAKRFCQAIKRIKTVKTEVLLPTFNRELDAVVENAVSISPDVRIVVVEGNYLLLKQEPWSELREVFDLSVFLRPEMSTLKERLISRWVGHGFAEGEAVERCENNDLVNANIVLECSVSPDVMVS